MSDGTGVAAAVARVLVRIQDAARRAARDPAAVTLVGATKTVAAERIAEALGAGLRDVGENRAQELVAKATLLAGLDPAPRWHFVGRLQRNKVAALAPWVTLWHSVDREPLGAEIARRSSGARVLVEVNLADEPQKGGCARTDAPRLADALRGLGLAVEGLMTVPPLGVDPRPVFADLRDLAGRLGLAELSMGMTDDFEVAVEEGATLVRVGRAIFGPREP